MPPLVAESGCVHDAGATPGGDGLEIHWALPAGARIPSMSFMRLSICRWGYGATVSRPTPDQDVGSSNLFAFIFASRKRAHPDLNQGLADLQSGGLTTELCTHSKLSLQMHSDRCLKTLWLSG